MNNLVINPVFQTGNDSSAGDIRKRNKPLSLKWHVVKSLYSSLSPGEVLWLNSADLQLISDLLGQGQVVKLRLYKGDGDVTV